jgi:hypothetical protein
LHNWGLLAERVTVPAADEIPPGRALAVDWWVKAQRDYFKKKAEDVLKGLVTMAVVAAVVGLLGLSWLIFRYFWDYSPTFPSRQHGTPSWGVWYVVDMLLGSGMVALCSALVRYYRFKRLWQLRAKAKKMHDDYFRPYSEKFEDRGKQMPTARNGALLALLKEDREEWIALGKHALLERKEWAERETPSAR